ncbi:MAG TPA: TetR/AcrR family transcriptional regulator [Caulobacteraceae bacterium]|jgi:AcrR family transcriptional regulator
MAKALRKKAKVEALRPAPPKERPAPSGESFTREEWVAKARKLLIRDGIAGVKIDRLAKNLGVTRGGFYWRFSGLNDLLDALLEDWRTTNTRSALEALHGGGTPVQRFANLMHVWIDEIDFDPSYDLAVRDWARVSPKADQAVRKFDDEFVEAFAELFREAGYPPDEALIRARIVHYHQVGYYAMRVKQSRDARYKTGDLYLRILTGFEGKFFDEIPKR